MMKRVGAIDGEGGAGLEIPMTPCAAFTFAMRRVLLLGRRNQELREGFTKGRCRSPLIPDQVEAPRHPEALHLQLLQNPGFEFRVHGK